MFVGAADLGPLALVGMVLIGLVAGLLGGLLGVGGGLVMIPAMLLLLGEAFGPGSLHTYKLAALAAAAVMSLRAAQRHARAGAVTPAIVVSITLGALGGVAAGTALGAQFAAEQTYVLRRIFGAFMLAAVAGEIWRSRLARDPDRPPRATCPAPARRLRYGLIAGAPAGLISGLLGVGGGVWAVPAQHVGFGVRLRHAIANSSCMIVAVATAAAVAQSIALAQMPDQHAVNGWILAAMLAPGAVLGGGLGAALTHRLDTRWLRRAFYVLLALTGVRLLLA